eukprot:TRINITY_DN236452_c0_g1_i2.p1 TRINITY_DN236452_c0_g1~~TRINITY_DN236452_c0_g1_i2.p1  ORF type:complete len:1020 (+),score=317.37 TRINITY_DN236452_c0_g1_i2:121-3180(+)
MSNFGIHEELWNYVEVIQEHFREHNHFLRISGTIEGSLEIVARQPHSEIIGTEYIKSINTYIYAAFSKDYPNLLPTFFSCLRSEFCSEPLVKVTRQFNRKEIAGYFGCLLYEGQIFGFDIMLKSFLTFLSLDDDERDYIKNIVSGSSSSEEEECGLTAIQVSVTEFQLMQDEIFEIQQQDEAKCCALFMGNGFWIIFLESGYGPVLQECFHDIVELVYPQVSEGQKMEFIIGDAILATRDENDCPDRVKIEKLDDKLIVRCTRVRMRELEDVIPKIVEIRNQDTQELHDIQDEVSIQIEEENLARRNQGLAISVLAAPLRFRIGKINYELSQRPHLRMVCNPRFGKNDMIEFPKQQVNISIEGGSLEDQRGLLAAIQKSLKPTLLFEVPEGVDQALCKEFSRKKMLIQRCKNGSYVAVGFKHPARKNISNCNVASCDCCDFEQFCQRAKMPRKAKSTKESGIAFVAVDFSNFFWNGDLKERSSSDKRRRVSAVQIVNRIHSCVKHHTDNADIHEVSIFCGSNKNMTPETCNYIESLGYQTDVEKIQDGKEQRVDLKVHLSLYSMVSKMKFEMESRKNALAYVMLFSGDGNMEEGHSFPNTLRDCLNTPNIQVFACGIAGTISSSYKQLAKYSDRFSQIELSVDDFEKAPNKKFKTEQTFEKKLRPMNHQSQTRTKTNNMNMKKSSVVAPNVLQKKTIRLNNAKPVLVIMKAIYPHHKIARIVLEKWLGTIFDNDSIREVEIDTNKMTISFSYLKKLNLTESQFVEEMSNQFVDKVLEYPDKNLEDILQLLRFKLGPLSGKFETVKLSDDEIIMIGTRSPSYVIIKKTKVKAVINQKQLNLIGLGANVITENTNAKQQQQQQQQQQMHHLDDTDFDGDEEDDDQDDSLLLSQDLDSVDNSAQTPIPSQVPLVPSQLRSPQRPQNGKSAIKKPLQPLKTPVGTTTSHSIITSTIPSSSSKPVVTSKTAITNVSSSSSSSKSNISNTNTNININDNKETKNNVAEVTTGFEEDEGIVDVIIE